jgi:predicted phage terminase large subunit-like protein
VTFNLGALVADLQALRPVDEPPAIAEPQLEPAPAPAPAPAPPAEAPAPAAFDADAAEEAAARTVLERAEARAAQGLRDGVLQANVVITIPSPRPHQRAVLDDDHRFKGWRAGRRVGKSRTEFIAAVRGHGPHVQNPDGTRGPRKYKGMAQGGDIAWIAPDYPQSATIWEEEVLPRFYGRQGVTVSEKHRLIGLGRRMGEDAGGEPIYQGSLRIRSAENINSIRGKEFDGIIGEEAAFWPFLSAWRRVLRPTLINRRGWAIIASSTDIGSDFNQLMQEIEAGKRGPNWAWFHNRTRDIPFIDEEEKADLANDYPPGSSEEAQELDAELLEALGTLFREEFLGYYDAISPQAVWIEGLRYEFEYLVMAVDLAASLKQRADYTAITVAGVCAPVDGLRRVAIVEVINEHLEGPQQIQAMGEIARKYRPAFIDIESVGYQLSAVQHLASELRGSGLVVEGVTLKGDKRAKAVPAAAAMSRREWFLPKVAPWLADTKAQLLKFPNGREGSKLVADHDDIVDTFSIIAARVGSRVNSTWRLRKIRR